jgi:phosphatidylserine/phosphatidylglycerophosphate/cardiolipin synthase-like enzyme
MNINYIFSKEGKSTKQRLLQLIDNTQETLDIAIYTVTNKEIISHLCYATNRGVKVRLITDKEQTDNIKLQNDCIQWLINNGIPVMINTHPAKMHLKLIISDKTTVASGSYNYTYAAEKGNDEVVVFINNKKLATEWAERFEMMWKDSNNFVKYPRDAHPKYA